MSKSNITKAFSFIVSAGFLAMTVGLGGCLEQSDYVDENEEAAEGIEEVDPGLDPAGFRPVPPLVERWVTYSASNTAHVTTNYTSSTFTIPSYLSYERIEVSTNTQCLGGSSASGDTMFRIFKDGVEWAVNDDSDCGTGSLASYIDEVGTPGTYEVRLGCYANTTCSGTAKILVR